MTHRIKMKLGKLACLLLALAMLAGCNAMPMIANVAKAVAAHEQHPEATQEPASEETQSPNPTAEPTAMPTSQPSEIISSDEGVIAQEEEMVIAQVNIYETDKDGIRRTELFYDESNRLILDIVAYGGSEYQFLLYHKFEYDAAGNCKSYSSNPEAPVELQIDRASSAPVSLSIYFDDGCTNYTFNPDGTVRGETFDGNTPANITYSYERYDTGIIIGGTGTESDGRVTRKVQCIYNDEDYGIPIATAITTAEHGLVLRDAPDGNKFDSIPYHTPVDVYMHQVGQNDVQWAYAVYYVEEGKYCTTGFVSTQYLDEIYLQ